MDVWSEQRRLSVALASWSALSIVGGAAVAVAGRRRGSPELVRFGKQNAYWGAIDGVIAGFGAWRSQSKRAALPDPDDATVAEEERASLHRLLLVNSALDVAYIAGGVWWAHARSPGDGIAVVIQGTFLLVLDTSFASRTR